MTAQHLFWHHYLGLRTPELDRRIANELLARMRDDGTWSIWFEGPPDLSTSIEAYVACRLAGVDPGPQALAYIQREGGIPKSRLFTKCFLALLGQWPWQRMAPIPPELVLLPPGSPVLDLRLLLLGAADVRRALGRAVAAPGAARRTSTCARSARGPGRRGRRRGRIALRRRAVADRRALDPRATGGGRLVGRDPAAVGLVDHRARRARPRARRPDARARPSRAGRASWSTTATGCGPRRASRRSGTRRSRCSRCAPAASRPTTRRSSRPATTSSREEVTVKGDWAIRKPGPRARRLGVRVRERPLSRRRRHGRRRARAPRARHRRGRDRARRRLARRDAVARRRLGRLRRRQQRDVALQDPVLRLRQGHRRAERRRHRALARDARRARRPRATRRSAASSGSSPSRRRTAPGSAAGA